MPSQVGIDPGRDWQRRRLKYLVKFLGGATPSTDDPTFWNGDIPWVSPKDMKVANISDAEDHLSDLGLASCSSSRVPAGSVLVVVRSGILRHMLPVAINARDVALNQDMKALIPRDGVVARFLRYVLMSNQPATLDMIRKQGATVESINQALLSNMVITLPGLEQQVAVADFLDHETAETDALVAKYERLTQLLEEKRIALITEAVTKGLDGNVPMKDSGVPAIGIVPASWDVIPLRRVIDKFVDYRGSTPTKVSSGIQIVTAANVKMAYINYDAVEAYISEDEYQTRMVRGLPAIGDVLLTMEAPLGQCAQVDNPQISLGQRVMLLKPNRFRIEPSFLKWYFLSRAGQDNLQSHATGSTALGIKASKLKGLSVCVPTLSAQRAICTHIEKKLEHVTALSARCAQAMRIVREHRSALITAAVTGQIDVTNYRSTKQPTDVPA